MGAVYLLADVAQTSQSAVSRVSKPAGGGKVGAWADLEIGDTAGLETCATARLEKLRRARTIHAGKKMMDYQLPVMDNPAGFPREISAR
jgi:hypothetical protein